MSGARARVPSGRDDWHLAKLRVLALFAFLTACGPDLPTQSVRQPIVGGSPEEGAPVNDVFLVVRTFNNGGGTICSGTLIAPRSIVTAGHCVDPAEQVGATAVTLTVTNAPTDEGVRRGEVIRVTEFRMHPGRTPGSESAKFDLAMIQLASPPAVTPRPLNREPLSNAADLLRVVGYGRTGADRDNSGTRRAVRATVTSVGADAFTFGVSNALGICVGDSGGPSLFTFPDGVERIVGVHSLTTTDQCGSGLDLRIDAHLDFIDQWLAEKEGITAPPAGPSRGCGCSSAPAAWALLALVGVARITRPKTKQGRR